MNARQLTESEATLAIEASTGKALKAARKRCESQLDYRGERMASAIAMIDEDLAASRSRYRKVKAEAAR